MKITIRTVTEPTVSLLELKGRFDAYEEEQAKQHLDQAITESSGRIVVNLSGVNFIDSTALALLVQGLKHCREQLGDLYICHLQEPIRIIFELTRLDKAFNILETEEDAIAAFRQ